MNKFKNIIIFMLLITISSVYQACARRIVAVIAVDRFNARQKLTEKALKEAELFTEKKKETFKKFLHSKAILNNDLTPYDLEYGPIIVISESTESIASEEACKESKPTESISPEQAFLQLKSTTDSLLDPNDRHHPIKYIQDMKKLEPYLDPIDHQDAIRGIRFMDDNKDKISLWHVRTWTNTDLNTALPMSEEFARQPLRTTITTICAKTRHPKPQQ